MNVGDKDFMAGRACFAKKQSNERESLVYMQKTHAVCDFIVFLTSLFSWVQTLCISMLDLDPNYESKSIKQDS